MALSMVSHDERSRKQFFHESSRPAGHSSINKNVSFGVLYVLNSNLFGSDDHINEIFLCHYFLVMLMAILSLTTENKIRCLATIYYKN